MPRIHQVAPVCIFCYGVCSWAHMRLGSHACLETLLSSEPDNGAAIRVRQLQPPLSGIFVESESGGGGEWK